LRGRPTSLLTGGVQVSDQPVTRDTYESLLPPIFVESPALGDEISSPVEVWGSARVAGNGFNVQVLAAGGTLLGEQAVPATPGARTGFDVTLPFAGAPGDGALVIYSESGADGSRVDEFGIPIRIASPAPIVGPGAVAVTAVGLGMLLYTVVVSPGYFVARRELAVVAVFAVLLLLTATALSLLLSGT
jgi:hypothetical protein